MPAKDEKVMVADQEEKTLKRNYHISQNKETGKWGVKFAKGDKVIKYFATQKEAIDYAKQLAKNQDGDITIHKKDGKIRKQKY